MKPRQQGDLGEAAAVWWLTSIGAIVSAPLFHSPDYDLIAQLGERLLRVQVKTCTHRQGKSFRVMIATNGGNQSWTGLTKYFDPSRCDGLFVLVGDGRRWFIPSNAVEGKRAINLGGPKYSDYEIDLEASNAFPIKAPLDLLRGRGSADVGESGQPVKLVQLLSEFESHLPHSSPEVVAGRRIGRTRISRNHQVTIPLWPFRAAGLAVGDAIRVEAQHDGRVVLERIGSPTAGASTDASASEPPAPASPA